MDPIKVYLDDLRVAPEGWIRVKTASEAIVLLQQGNVVEISLDHDLGDEENGTGYDVILWMEEKAFLEKFKCPRIHIHTANISAREKMEKGVSKIRSASL